MEILCFTWTTIRELKILPSWLQKIFRKLIQPKHPTSDVDDRLYAILNTHKPRREVELAAIVKEIGCECVAFVVVNTWKIKIFGWEVWMDGRKITFCYHIMKIASKKLIDEWPEGNDFELSLINNSLSAVFVQVYSDINSLKWRTVNLSWTEFLHFDFKLPSRAIKKCIWLACI